MITTASADLWELALNRQQVDPGELAFALENQLRDNHPDFRTRLLMRDSLDALAGFWGVQRVRDWIEESPSRASLADFWASNLGPPGFQLLGNRIIETTKPQTIRRFFRELGLNVCSPIQVIVGGSASLILAGLLSRRIEHLEIRAQREMLDSLASRYGIRIAHFQSHFLPSGWEQRVRSLGVFDRLTVVLVDPYDLFVGKLFSPRDKDLDDLRELSSRFEKSTIERRIRESAAPLRSEAAWAEAGARNWYIVYGEPLPE